MFHFQPLIIVLRSISDWLRSIHLLSSLNSWAMWARTLTKRKPGWH